MILSCECNELVLNNVAVESNPLLRIRKHCATSRYPILCLGHASSSWLVVIGTGVSGEPIWCKSPENRKRMIENLDPMLEADVPSTKPTA